MFLKHWSLTYIQHKSWEKGDNLHIDEISPLVKPKENWITGGIILLDILCEIVGGQDYIPVLCIPLVNSRTSTPPKEIPEQVNLTFFHNELDMTPPSLFLYPGTDNSYKSYWNSCYHIKSISYSIKKEVFYKEEQESNAEYCRTIFIKPINRQLFTF